MNRVQTLVVKAKTPVPRTSGDEPRRLAELEGEDACSPHERG